MEQRTWSIRGWLGILIAAMAVPLLVLLVTMFPWEVRREQGRAATPPRATMACLPLRASPTTSCPCLEQAAETVAEEGVLVGDDDAYRASLPEGDG
jgi:hypothetical protein